MDFDVDAEAAKNVTCLRVTFKNLGSSIAHVPVLSTKTSYGTPTANENNVTNIAPGETIEFTYVLAPQCREDGVMLNLSDFYLYMRANIKSDLEIQKVSFVTRELEK